MINKYFDGVVVNKNVNEDIDNDLKDIVLSAKDKVNDKMDNLRIADSLDEVFEIFKRCNKYIDETTPWILAKDESKLDRLSTVMYNLVESIRIGAVLLQAYLPDTASSIFNQINTDITSYDTIGEFGKYVSGTKVGEAKVLFQRIEEK